MSYILEALKKAQAERQLGNAPTIHAPQPVPALQPRAAAGRRPLLIGLGAGALAVVLGGLFAWQRTPAPAPLAAPTVPAPAGQPALAATSALPGPPAASAGSGQPPASAPAPGAGAVSNTLEVSAPPASPAPPAPSRAARQAEAPVRSAAPAAAGRAGGDAPASVPPARAAAVAQAPAPAPEDGLPYLQQLPAAVQRDIPRVHFGGYMYSANPADRLLLVDKTLRHEGEEVAPGLVLEKLLPKAAVMNYRGVRFRAAY